MRPQFHALRVAAVDPLTDDAVAVTFAVPPELREAYSFVAGQHLTVRRFTDTEEARRSYSICSTPSELAARGLVRIGVKQIAGGVFSTYAAKALAVGESVDVLPPLGHFTTAFEKTRTKRYAAIAAGSGITPVLSLLTTGLAVEPSSHFTLLYGNRAAATVMFSEELADLKDRYPGRLQVLHVLSREPQLSPLLSGRIDAARLREILGHTELLDAATVDEWFLCGPYGMVLDAKGVLAERGVPEERVHTELFHVDEPPVEATSALAEPVAGGATAAVTIILDGRESTFAMDRGERVLDAALRVRGELPYACKGGVCSTCRAKVVEGEVAMVRNYALEPSEVAAGYVLTCQSRPVTDKIIIDYDA